MNMPQVTSVTSIDDSTTGVDPTDFDAVIISATVFSGNILTTYGGDGSTLFGAAVPILSMEPGLADDIPLNNDAATQGQDNTFAITFDDITGFVETIIGGDNQRVPEPSTLLLALAGLLSIAWFARRRVAGQ